MVPLDGSKVAECVLPHLETVTKGCIPPPSIVLVRAVEPISVPVGREVAQFSSLEDIKKFEGHQKAEAEKYLSEMVGYLKERGIRAESAIVYGKPGLALSDYAEKNSVDLIVMATHGRSGLSRIVMGSVAEHMVRASRSAVLLVRAFTTPADTQQARPSSEKG